MTGLNPAAFYSTEKPKSKSKAFNKKNTNNINGDFSKYKNKCWIHVFCIRHQWQDFMYTFFLITHIIYLYLFVISGPIPQINLQFNGQNFQLSTSTQQNKGTIRISFPLFCPFPAVQVVQSTVNQQNGARSSSCLWAEGFSNWGLLYCEE